jgi:signal transduction histidine kinase
MSLKWKIVLILAAFTAVYVAGYYGVNGAVTTAGFARIEQRRGELNMTRCAKALRERVASLERLTRDWANWDDTYRYVAHPYAEYEEANLVPSTMVNAELNLLVIADARTKIVWQRFVDLKGEEAVDRPSFVATDLATDHPALVCRRAGGQVSGVYMADAGPMLIAACPILTSDEEGPARGTLIMGQLLDKDALHHISETVELDVESRPLPGSKEKTLTGGLIALKRLNERTLEGTIVVDDLAGRPALALAATMPRDIMAQGRATICAGSYSLLVMAVLIAALLFFLLRAWVIRPICSLTEEVSEIAGGQPRERLDPVGTGEVRRLSLAFDHLLRNRNCAEAQLQERVAELEAATQRIQQQQEDIVRASKLASLGTMAAGVAHEINNPLVAVAGYSEVLLDKLDRLAESAPPDVVEYYRKRLGIINDEAFRCKSITQGLLSFSRGSAAVSKEPFDIRAVIAHAIELTAAHTRHTPASSVVMDLGSEPIIVCAGRDGLVQVFLNLAMNAFDAMPTGALLHVTARSAGEMAEVAFRDEGQGMDADTVLHIFEPFFTTKLAGEGTGLGLSVAQGIVKANGGRIEIESAVGRGTTVTVRLPLAAAREEAADAA